MTPMASVFGKTKASVFVATLSLVALTIPSMGLAQTTNITSSGLNTKVTTSGTTRLIDGGTRPTGTTGRPNLFHSFGNFSIGTGETALFRAIDVVGGVDTAYAGSSIHNIIGRVTGNNPSSLFGTLDTKSNFPTANLFLVNPNGIVFGATASINVGGAANFLAGDYLKLADNALFFANPHQSTTLTIAPVTAFGFLGGNPAASSTLAGSIEIRGGTVANGSTITLVGRDIPVSGGTSKPGIIATGGTLSNPGGDLQLASVGKPKSAAGADIGVGDVSSAKTNGGFIGLGAVTLTGGASLNTSGPAAGKIIMRGGKLVLDNASLVSETSSGHGRGISLTADQLTIKNGATVASDTTGSGHAGAITFNVNTLNLTGSSHVTSTSSSPDSNAGYAGTIKVQGQVAPRASLINVADSAIATKADGGAAGSISLAGDRITLTDSKISANISSTSFEYVSRRLQPPSNITMTTSNLAISGGQISTALISETGPRLSMPNAGDITFNIHDMNAKGVTVDSGSISAGYEEGNGIERTGNAGAISVQGIGGNGTRAHNVTVANSAFSSTAHSGAGVPKGGPITVQATNIQLSNVSLYSQSYEAPSGNISLDALNSLAIGNSMIQSGAAVGQGSPGSLTLQAGRGIDIDASTFFVGGSRAGDIRVLSPEGRVTLRNSSFYAANYVEPGTISVDAKTLNISGTRIDTSSYGEGPGGNIRLQARGNLNILDGSVITAETTAVTGGDAGDINLIAGHNLTLREALVSTETKSATASGGNIKLTAPFIVNIVDSTLTSSVQGQAGSNAGNISIDPLLVVIRNSQIKANANAGAGGNVSITANGSVLVDRNSQLSASAGPAGVSGSINITSPIQIRGGSLVPLKRGDADVR